MVTRHEADAHQVEPAARYPQFSVPPVRHEWVPRPRLVDRLRECASLPVWVVASAGYGKSTLLAQWANEDPRPAAWVRLSGMHNDPAVLIADLALAVRTIKARKSREASRLTDASVRDIFNDVSRPFILVLDDADHISGDESIEALRYVAEHIPSGAALAFATRREPWPGLPRLRANHELYEVGATDLATTDAEAGDLLRAAGIDADDRVVKILVERTEGWPAGLYLAALSLQGVPDLAAAAETFAGDDRNVVDYLRGEVLSALPRKTADFLLRTSILEQLSGPLCDAVLERKGSTQLLEDIHASNLLLNPLDRNREWYHCHNLFREMLQSELRRSKPDLERGLHARACAWFIAHGPLDAAVHHAQAAQEDELAGALILEGVPKYLWSGRTQSLALWLSSYSRAAVAARPALVVTSAWLALAEGDWAELKYWAEVAALAPPDVMLPDGTSLRSASTLFRAILGQGGLNQVRDDAALAYESSEPASAARSVACLTEGSALRLLGDVSRARVRLREGVVIGRMLAPTVEAQCLAQLAILEADSGQWIDAGELAAEAMNIVVSLDLVDRPPVAMVFAISALVHARGGAVSAARSEAKRATFLSTMPRDVAPWFAADARLLIARTHLHLGDVAIAPLLLREAQSIASRTPDLDLLLEHIENAQTRARTLRAPLGVVATPLTPAEMRVLRFLPTHLTFPAIADELFVSRNTVKTQAISIYRKLGVSSRDPAVEAARDLGLLEP